MMEEEEVMAASPLVAANVMMQNTSNYYTQIKLE